MSGPVAQRRVRRDVLGVVAAEPVGGVRVVENHAGVGCRPRLLVTSTIRSGRMGGPRRGPQVSACMAPDLRPDAVAALGFSIAWAAALLGGMGVFLR